MLDQNGSGDYSFFLTADTENSQTFSDVLNHDIPYHLAQGNYDIDFILIIGDVVMDPSNMYYQTYYDEASSFMEETGIPIITVVGNHELNADNADIIFNDFVGDLNFEFTYNESLFIATHNNQTVAGYSGPSDEGEDFSISPDRTEEVSEILDNADANHIFSLTHQVILSNEVSCWIDGYAEYNAVLHEHDITAYFTGHLHKYSVQRDQSDFLELQVSGLGDNILLGSDGNPASPVISPPFNISHQNFYHIVNVSDDEVDFEVFIRNSNSSAPFFDEDPAFAFGINDCFDNNCLSQEDVMYYTEDVTPSIDYYCGNNICYVCIETFDEGYKDLSLMYGSTHLDFNDAIQIHDKGLCFPISCDPCIETTLSFDICADFFDDNDDNSPVNHAISNNICNSDPCVLFCSDEDLILTNGQSMTLDYIWYHYNNIYVRNGSELIIKDAQLNMQGEIFLEQGSRLIVENSTIGSCEAGSLWDGIRMEGGVAQTDPEGVLDPMGALPEKISII